MNREQLIESGKSAGMATAGDALEALINLDIAIINLGWDPDNLEEA